MAAKNEIVVPEALIASGAAVGLDRDGIAKILQALMQYGPMFIQFILSMLQKPTPPVAGKIKGGCSHEHACKCHDAMIHALMAAHLSAQCCCDCCE